MTWWSQPQHPSVTTQNQKEHGENSNHEKLGPHQPGNAGARAAHAVDLPCRQLVDPGLDPFQAAFLLPDGKRQFIPGESPQTFFGGLNLFVTRVARSQG